MKSSMFHTQIATSIAFVSALLYSACSTDVAGTDEQTNSVAGKDDNTSTGISADIPTDTLFNIESSSSFEVPFSSSSIDSGSTGTILRPGINGAIDSLEFEQFDTPLIPESIFTLDTLHTAPAFDICTGEYCNIDTRKKIIGTKGTFYYKMEPWEAKVECEANDSQSSSYSVSKYGSTIKEFVSLDEGEVEIFKQDCIAEGGNIGSDIFSGSDIPSNSTTCTLSNADEFYYYDSNWSKYSQIILSHCITSKL